MGMTQSSELFKKRGFSCWWQRGAESQSLRKTGHALVSLKRKGGTPGVLWAGGAGGASSSQTARKQTPQTYNCKKLGSAHNPNDLRTQSGLSAFGSALWRPRQIHLDFWLTELQDNKWMWSEVTAYVKEWMNQCANRRFIIIIRKCQVSLTHHQIAEAK